MIPEDLRPFFWEVDIKSFDPAMHSHYTIARLLEYGNPAAISWMRAHFSTALVRDVICSERKLSPKSATFWGLVYGIPFDEIAALGA